MLPLETDAGTLCAQPLRFLRSRRATQCKVALRKPTKALDDVALLISVSCSQREQVGKLRGALGGQASVRTYRFLLQFPRFRVLHWHVEENALHRIQRSIGAQLRAADGERQCPVIL